LPDMGFPFLKSPAVSRGTPWPSLQIGARNDFVSPAYAKSKLKRCRLCQK
jgi:hypothetical protein